MTYASAVNWLNDANLFNIVSTAKGYLLSRWNQNYVESVDLIETDFITLEWNSIKVYVSQWHTKNGAITGTFGSGVTVSPKTLPSIPQKQLSFSDQMIDLDKLNEALKDIPEMHDFTWKPPSDNKKQGCLHIWTLYQGLSESFNHCRLCGVKQ